MEKQNQLLTAMEFTNTSYPPKRTGVRKLWSKESLKWICISALCSSGKDEVGSIRYGSIRFKYIQIGLFWGLTSMLARMQDLNVIFSLSGNRCVCFLFVHRRMPSMTQEFFPGLCGD